MRNNWAERRARLDTLADINPSLHKHLTSERPKRMLALDGRGVLGVMEIAFIERIEALLREKYNDPQLSLADHFDIIGGTSTGAIIATALALGKSTAEIKDLYFNMVGDIFKRPLLSVPGLAPKFDGRILANKLRSELGERELQSSDLKTGLAIISKRMDTGSPWVLTNNPASAYWEDGDYIGNKRYKLRDIVRASTAAPFYYSPKPIKIVENEPPGLFVDGGLTPHNSPSLLLLMLANIEGYGFHWPIGKDNILLISIGCGWLRPRITQRK